MSTWEAWLDRLTHEPTPVDEAAIWGYLDGEQTVWCSTPGLTGILVSEIQDMAHNRGKFTISGAFLAGRKCRLLRDAMEIDGVDCCDLKTAACEGKPAVNVCVGKSKKAFVIAFAKEAAGGGALSARVHQVTDELKKCNY